MDIVGFLSVFSEEFLQIKSALLKIYSYSGKFFQPYNTDYNTDGEVYNP